MWKKKKKQILFVLVVIFILFILITGGIFLFKSVSPRESISDDDLIVHFKDDSHVVLNNKLPISDKLGKDMDGTEIEDGIYGFIEFSVQNSTSKSGSYQIYVTKDAKAENLISEKYIKLYLTDGKDQALGEFRGNKIPTFDSLLVPKEQLDSKLLYRDDISGKEKKTYRLHVWLSDSYAVSSNSENFIFDIEVKSR